LDTGVFSEQMSTIVIQVFRQFPINYVSIIIVITNTKLHCTTKIGRLVYPV